MPITIRTSSNPPRAWAQPAASSSAELLKKSHSEYSPSMQIIQSSFKDNSKDYISPHKNGLIHAAFHAYSSHHHLTFRPEDVWFSILTQLSFYVNAHAEELRSIFVAHEGQKEVEVSTVGSIKTVDFGELAVAMTNEMEKHIVDEGLRKWILPDFTTTEHSDVVTAAVLMMGTLQKYFSYKMSLLCGIPSVTLLGEKDDWVKIRNRLDRIEQWGEEPTQFAARLRTVLDYFIRSFDDPKDARVLEFWSKLAHHVGGGSGPTYLSGWITAFSLWDSDGKTISSHNDSAICDIEGTRFLPVDTTDIPSASVSVPVKVDDNGTEYKTKMVAGSVGVKVSSSGDFLDDTQYPYHGNGSKQVQAGTTTGLDTIQPVSGWWMYECGSDDK